MIQQGLKAEWHYFTADNKLILSVYRQPNSAMSRLDFVEGFIDGKSDFDVEQLREMAALLLKAADYQFPADFIPKVQVDNTSATAILAKIVDDEAARQATGK